MHRIPTFIKLGLLAVVALALMAPAASNTGQSSAAGDSLYLFVKGVKQGDIKGGVTQKGRDGLIEVAAWSHEVTSPRDPASGQATGKRQHKPLMITKTIDKATPKLYQALTQNEVLTSVELRFYQTLSTAKSGSAGTSVIYFTVKLENAHITSIENRKDETLDREIETVSFTYQKITWTWVDGGITAEDDWEAPVV